jgi:NTP pyrophosphatase (non-canonical NTP hydrolase)
MIEQIEHVLNSEQIFSADGEIIQELRRAEKKFPTWPLDPIHAVSILAEESGEAVKAALHFYYDKESIEEFRKEVIQTGAMALRLLIFIDLHYRKKP